MIATERLPSPEPDLAEVEQLLERAAREVTRRRLETPAILALEMHRPIAFLGSQALVLFTPMLAPAFGLKNMELLIRVLERRENLERLVCRIEELAAERDAMREQAAKGDPDE
jgi:hypothetical protein